MKNINTLVLLFILNLSFSQTNSDFVKYYAAIDYVVNNELLIKKSGSYFKKYKSNNLFLSSGIDLIWFNSNLCYKLYINKNEFITETEFNSDFDKYCKQIWEGYLIKDSTESKYLNDSLYSNLTEYLEKHLKKISDKNSKWKLSLSIIYYNCLSVNITGQNYLFGDSFYLVLIFDDKDQIIEVIIY
ncbi:MAG: hypothetical protein RBS13_01450 [Bacteroidales bacterium]|jgi:hypothetical protein|nr:hypothetical protein [Bacteroidales bacterium]